MDRMGWIAAAAALALAVGLAARGVLWRIVVLEHERVLLYRRGRLARVLDAGAYWIAWPARRLVRVDVRPRILATAGQEVPSRDGTPVRVTLAVRYRVADPVAALARSNAYEEALYLEAQLALRDLLAGLDVEELVERRRQLATELGAALAPRAAALGLEVETAGIKDLTFSAPIKEAFARVVEARKAAQAALERARGETAALRHLANTARMLESNPGLATLRTLQALDNGRNTLVLGHPGALFPGAASRPDRTVADEGREESGR